MKRCAACALYCSRSLKLGAAATKALENKHERRLSPPAAAACDCSELAGEASLRSLMHTSEKWLIG